MKRMPEALNAIGSPNKTLRMMKRTLFFLLILSLSAGSCREKSSVAEEKRLAERILRDTLMHRVAAMAGDVVRGGFNAGDGYGEVWIRDYNTFIELAMEVLPDSLIRDNLLTFFRFQGETGDIVDGFIDICRASRSDIGYNYRYTALEPRYAAHKNTVETDQESSLVQAVWRYVSKSGNRTFLQQTVEGKTVEQRLEQALE